MTDFESLWGEDESELLPETSSKKIKKIKEKISKPKVPLTPEKALKSKTVSIVDKLAIIRENVLHTLGTYVNNTVVIKSKEQLKAYFDHAIANKIIAVDTETNNSLDTMTCKLMGPCIYTPGQKNAYIPINHVNLETQERLDWQITEEDFAEQLRRLGNTKVIFHNAKFDYQVIKQTCGVELNIDWDTLICARILNENERAGLKEQYITKIDPSIQKYDIEKLFTGVEYAVVDPDLFALYAATDAFMTYRLYEWQKKQLDLKENKSLHKIFFDIEMPVVKVTAEMEYTGVAFDLEYAKKLGEYYHKLSEDNDAALYKELETYKDKIEAWKKTPDATNVPKIYISKEEITKSIEFDYDGKIEADIYKRFSEVDEKGNRFKYGKSKLEQLEDPISLTSNTQLAILLYDILGVREGIAQKKDKKNPDKPLRGVGEEILEAIAEEYDISLCKMILENRGFNKLISTYIDALPERVCERDGRLHAHFNQIGADTGRFSSSDPNL